MSARGEDRARRRARLALAALAGLILAGSFALLWSGRYAHERRPAAPSPAGPHVAQSSLEHLAGEIQDQVARQSAQANLARWDREHHMVPGAAAPIAAGQSRVAAAATRVVRRWLAGYLPYEVDRLRAGSREDLLASSSARLAGSLLAHPPLIPPTQQLHPPPEGRTVNVITTLTPARGRARAYVEVAYGLARVGFHLTLLDEPARGWLVVGFQG